MRNLFTLIMVIFYATSGYSQDSFIKQSELRINKMLVLETDTNYKYGEVSIQLAGGIVQINVNRIGIYNITGCATGEGGGYVENPELGYNFEVGFNIGFSSGKWIFRPSYSLSSSKIHGYSHCHYAGFGPPGPYNNVYATAYYHGIEFSVLKKMINRRFQLYAGIGLNTTTVSAKGKLISENNYFDYGPCKCQVSYYYESEYASSGENFYRLNGVIQAGYNISKTINVFTLIKPSYLRKFDSGGRTNFFITYNLGLKISLVPANKLL